MSFAVNLLSDREREILSFLAKYRDADVMRFESSNGDSLSVQGVGANADLEINTPSFERLLVSRLVINTEGDLHCITHDGIECVLGFQK